MRELAAKRIDGYYQLGAKVDHDGRPVPVAHMWENPRSLLQEVEAEALQAEHVPHDIIYGSGLAVAVQELAHGRC